MGWKAFLCFAILLVGSRTDADEFVKIGEVNPITGAIGRYGTTCHQGIQLAIDQANTRGGVLGKKIALMTEDNQSKPARLQRLSANLSLRTKSLRLWAI